MHLLLVVVMAVASGCFAKPGFTERTDASSGDDDAAGSDAAPDACARHWGAPLPIAELMNMVAGEPTMTADQKYMMWAIQTGLPAPNQWQIRWADRPTATGTFAPSSTEPFASSNMTDMDPSITDDGLLVVFHAGSPSRLKQATRPDRISAWTVAPLPGDPGMDVTSLDVSGDGLAVYFTVGVDLYSIKRSSRTASFGAVGPQLAQQLQFPSISGDQLTLYYSVNNTGVYAKHRNTTSEAFGAMADTVFATGKDPDVIADGTTMVIGVNSTGAGLSTFVCD